LARLNVIPGVDVVSRIGLLAGVVVSLVLVTAPAAAADTRIEVEAGYADGQIVPGRPVPVRVQVRADRLVEGTIQVTPRVLGEDMAGTTMAVEVPGGSVKDYLVVVPTEWRGTVGPSEMQVTLSAGDEKAEAVDALSWTGSDEVVGLLPGLASQVPDPVPLAIGPGTARFDQLDDRVLAAPGALGPLGTIVAGPDGLALLPAEAQRNVLDWVEKGGQLLVDAPPGTPVAGLPDGWQPSGARRAAGDGWVRLTGGAAAGGRWAEIIEPTRQFSLQELSFGGWAPEGIPDSVARDAGLRIPDITWLSGFLVAYVVIAGPVTFLLLRRARRTTLAWVAVPTVAVVFTAGAWVAGSSLRSEAKASHGSIVQASPLGSQVVSYVGLTSRDGADPTVSFPIGWQASGLGAGAGRLGMAIPFDEGFAGVSGEDLGSGPASPVALATDDGRPALELPLSPGDFGVVTGRGRIDGDSPLEVTASATGDGSVSGTVTNSSDVDLERVIVALAGTVADVGDVAAGVTVEWSIPRASAAAFDPENDPWAPIEQPWDDASGWDGTLDADSIVNYAVYSSEIGIDVDSYPPGVAVAAGWTTDWAPPVEVRSGMADGRTAFVARAPVTAEPGTVPAVAVRRELVRGPGATRHDPPIEIVDSGEAIGAVARFTLPDGADPSTPLALDASYPIAAAEVWDGHAWVGLELADGTGAAEGTDGPDAPADSDAGTEGRFDVPVPAPGAGIPRGPLPPPKPLVIGGGFDPSSPPRTALLPAGVVHDGVVYVRIAMSPDLLPRMVLQVRGAA
jgi:hypothetical protein